MTNVKKLAELACVKADLLTLARSVYDGVITKTDADAELAELCTRMGPALVRSLDEYYERELARLRSRTEPHS
jgi:hypothetical protein